MKTRKVQPERELQNTICDYLTIMKIPFITYDSKGSYDPIKKIFRKGVKYKMLGVSDLIVFLKYKCKVLFIEVKYDKGKQSDTQKIFEKWVNDLNIWQPPFAAYYIVRSIEDIKTILNKENDYVKSKNYESKSFDTINR